MLSFPPIRAQKSGLHEKPVELSEILYFRKNTVFVFDEKIFGYEK